MIGPIFVVIVALLVAIWLLSRRPRLFQWRTINVNGRQRRYLVRSADEDSHPKPLLLCFHGGFARVESLAQTSGAAEAGARHGWMVIFPEATEGWVDARPERGGSTRDIDFVEALVGSLGRTNQIDPSRVFAFGISNGGLFLFRLASERAKHFAGFATALANMPVAALPTVSGPPVPIAMIFGRQDRVMPWGGGSIARGQRTGVGGEVVSADATRRYWLKRNAARPIPRIQRRVNAGHEIEIEDYAAGPDGAPVRFVSIGDWGHRWPSLAGELSGPDNFNAADLFMDFFSGLNQAGTSKPIFPSAAEERDASA